MLGILEEIERNIGFNPLYIGSMCNKESLKKRMNYGGFQSPLYRVNV